MLLSTIQIQYLSFFLFFFNWKKSFSFFLIGKKDYTILFTFFTSAKTQTVKNED